MTNQAPGPELRSANEVGQDLTSASQLDQHYVLAKTEYDRAIASIGIQPGWRVLDAGSGNGVFLPQIATLVGPRGSVVALDHSAQNIDGVERWVREAKPAARVEGRVGGVTALPFEADSFDCVWCANVSQYLIDAELAQAVAEFARVTKPGGLVAIKEFDATLWQLHPVDLRLIWRFLDASATSGMTQAYGTQRSWGLSRIMRAHDLEIIKREGTLVERAAPLSPSTIAYLGDVFRWMASFVPTLHLSDSDKADWRHLSESIEDVLNDPDALYRELFTVTVGRMPLEGK